MTTEKIAKKPNKSEIARSILKEIGALTSKPPEGWRQQLEQRLAEQNLTMSRVMIYAVRNKAMAKKQEIKAAKAAASLPTKRNNPKAKDKVFSDFLKVAEVAKSVGGLDNMLEIIHTLKKLF